jgi:hypothetical protein
VKIAFEGNVPVPHERLMEQVSHARGLGLPFVREVEPHGRRLAVVGGGPSIVEHVEEIRQFTDVWAINGACGFLRARGIESTLVSLDPIEALAERVLGARKAILSTRCHPKVFETLAGCEIQLFDVLQDAVPGSERGVWGSVSTVLSVFDLAPLMGYRDAVFYGCEGSYAVSTHAYMNDPECDDYRFVVACGGREYLTAPDLYMQTMQLSKLLRFTHDRFKEKSGGLLRAFIAERMKVEIHKSMEIVPEHDIVMVSRKLLAGLTPDNEASAAVKREALDECVT